VAVLLERIRSAGALTVGSSRGAEEIAAGGIGGTQINSEVLIVPRLSSLGAPDSRNCQDSKTYQS
jgi:hypothetical protein